MILWYDLRCLTRAYQFAYLAVYSHGRYWKLCNSCCSQNMTATQNIDVFVIFHSKSRVGDDSTFWQCGNNRSGTITLELTSAARFTSSTSAQQPNYGQPLQLLSFPVGPCRRWIWWKMHEHMVIVKIPHILQSLPVDVCYLSMVDNKVLPSKSESWTLGKYQCKCKTTVENITSTNICQKSKLWRQTENRRKFVCI